MKTTLEYKVAEPHIKENAACNCISIADGNSTIVNKNGEASFRAARESEIIFRNSQAKWRSRG